MTNPQSPEAVEKSALAAIASQDAQAHAYIESFPVGAHSSAMAQWINGLAQVEWGYRQYSPTATWLQQQGRPQVWQRLDATLRDLAQARDTYIATYNDTLQTENKIAGIWQNAYQFRTQQMIAAADYQRAVSQQQVQQWLDVNEQRCFDCHRYIGIAGGGHCYDCARRRGWVL